MGADIDIESVLASPELRSSGDQLWDPDTLPWVPQADGVSARLLHISTENGSWANLLRVTKQGTVSLHRHLGPVEAWVVGGQWRYLEHDWVARPGMYVFEPAGDVHTLVNAGTDEMITLFVIHGPIEYLSPDGDVIFTETAETKLTRYVRYCEANNLPLAPLLA